MEFYMFCQILRSKYQSPQIIFCKQHKTYLFFLDLYAYFSYNHILMQKEQISRLTENITKTIDENLKLMFGSLMSVISSAKKTSQNKQSDGRSKYEKRTMQFKKEERNLFGSENKEQKRIFIQDGTYSSLDQQSKSKNQPFASLFKDNQSMTDPRLKIIDLQIPTLPQQHENLAQRKQIVQQWVFYICKNIFSIGFTAFKNQEVDLPQVNALCSFNLLLNILKFIKKNQLKQKEIKQIDNILRSDIPNYFCQLYPQTQQNEPNVQLSDIVINRDDMQDPANDFVLRSKVQFKLKPEGKNYNTQIMHFLNYVINLLNAQQKITTQQEILEELELGSDSEQLSLAKRFQLDMKGIFQLVKSQQNVRKIDKFNPKKPQKINLKSCQDKLINLEIKSEKIVPSSNLEQKLLVMQKNQREIKMAKMKQAYEKDVKQYTKYKIGRKISSNIRTFRDAEIQNGNLKIKSSELCRVMIKWIQQLQSYFKSDTILNRDHPFKMMDGSQGYLMEKQFSILNNLLQQCYSAPGGPKEYLQIIAQNNYNHQSHFSNQDCPKVLKKYGVQEATVGRFASVIHMNTENYLIGYLNCLIHAILKATSIFKKFVLISNRFYDYVVSVSYDQIQKYCEESDEEGQKKQRKVDHLVPNLITFKLGDLLRCKVSSKDKEIKSLYKYLEKVSLYNHSFLKIVRVKNRLQTGNRDILINLLYRNTMLVEMQLAINNQNASNKFIEHSNSFNHYIYELKRAKFGPITELCSIWVSKDPRSKIFIEELLHNNQIHPKQIQQEGIQSKLNQNKLKIFCTHKLWKKLQMPFQCDSCHYYYLSIFFGSSVCSSCGIKKCFHCSFRQKSKQEKQKIFPQMFEKDRAIYVDTHKKFYKVKDKQFNEASQIIPDVGYLVNINSQPKNVKKYFKVVNDEQIVHLFERVGQNDLALIAEIKNVRSLKSLIVENIFGKIEQNFLQGIKEEKGFEKIEENNKMTLKEAKMKYYIPEYFKKCIQKQKASITMVGLDLDQNALKFKRLKTYSYWSNLKKLNLSENKIRSMDCILNKRPINLQILDLSYNPIKFFTPKKQFLDQQFNEQVLVSIQKLKSLKLRNTKLQRLDNQIRCLKNLIKIDLAYSLIEELPDAFVEISSLITVNINFTLIKKLPLQFGRLKNLQDLMMNNCQLTELPDSFGELCSLKDLEMRSTLIKVLPQSFCNLKKLMQLALSGALEYLPQNFGNLESLRNLQICETQITFLPESFCLLQSLKFLEINENRLLKNLPDNFYKLPTLQKLQIQQNGFYQLPISFEKLPQPRFLSLKFIQKDIISEPSQKCIFCEQKLKFPVYCLQKAQKLIQYHCVQCFKKNQKNKKNVILLMQKDSSIPLKNLRKKKSGKSYFTKAIGNISLQFKCKRCYKESKGLHEAHYRCLNCMQQSYQLCEECMQEILRGRNTFFDLSPSTIKCQQGLKKIKNKHTKSHCYKRVEAPPLTGLFFNIFSQPLSPGKERLLKNRE